LVIEVAIVRPGPILGRHGASLSTPPRGQRGRRLPKPELEKVLGKNWRTTVQEQAMRVAIECAGFTPGQADQLRRAMATQAYRRGIRGDADFRDGGERL
jgi:error-prone DNA polymerase